MARAWRLGTTSYIYPDTALANVRRLVGRVDDIELLFFDLSDPRGLPGAGELAEMVRLKARHGLTFTLHTPLGASLASADERRRALGVEEVLRAIDLARPIAAERTIVHVYRGDREGEPIPDDLHAWQRRAARSLEAILASGVEAEDLCVEWIDYPLDLLDPVLRDLGVRIALDVGHLHRDDLEPGPVLERFLERTRVIHWHGTDESGKDHRSLAWYPWEEGRRLVSHLDSAAWEGVLTIEVFGERDFESSLKRLASLQARANRSDAGVGAESRSA